MLRLASILLLSVVVVTLSAIVNSVAADILFGTFTPTSTQAGVPSIFGAINDWLGQSVPGGQYLQSIRVASIGWGPTADIQSQVEQLADWARNDAVVIVLSWLPYPYKTWASPTPNLDIASGLYDDYIDQFLGNLSSLYVYAEAPTRTRLVYLRLAPEANGNFFPWSPECGYSCTSTGQNISQTPTDYIAMWSHVMSKVRDPKYKLGPDVLQTVFDVSTFDATQYPFEKFYPGDGSVNWLSATGENFGTEMPGNSWQSPEQLLGSTIARLNNLPGNTGGRLPIAISTASVSSPNGVAAKDAWIGSLFNYLKSVSNIKMITYHNAEISATDLPVFGGSDGLVQWNSTVSDFHYWTFPSFRNAVTQTPFVTPNVYLPTLITQAQFFGQA